MDVAAGRQRAQRVDMPGREPRQAEQRQPLGEIDERRVLAEPRTRAGEPLGRPGLGDRLAQTAPQLDLPGRVGRDAGVVPRGPRADHVRPVERVAVEQVGDVSGRSRTSTPLGVAAAPEVLGEAAQPRLAERVHHDLEQWPHGPLGRPGIRVGLYAGGGRHRVADQRRPGGK